MQESDLSLSEQVVLYFYHDQVFHHENIVAALQNVEQRHKKVEFYAIDLDAFGNMRQRFNLTCVPSIIFLIDGYEKKRVKGLTVIGALDDICNCTRSKTEKKYE